MQIQRSIAGLYRKEEVFPQNKRQGRLYEIIYWINRQQGYFHQSLDRGMQREMPI